MFLYRYLSALSRFVRLPPWEYHLSGRAVCTTESLPAPKLLSSASTGRETGRQMPAIYQTYPASQANRQTQAPL